MLSAFGVEHICKLNEKGLQTLTRVHHYATETANVSQDTARVRAAHAKQTRTRRILEEAKRNRSLPSSFIGDREPRIARMDAGFVQGRDATLKTQTAGKQHTADARARIGLPSSPPKRSRP